MPEAQHPQIIVFVDDDADDRLLVRDAINESRTHASLVCLKDGVDLLEYLRGRGDYETEVAAVRPALVLLDLNMPRMNGTSALREIKSDPELRHIPVVIFTTSRAETDVLLSYQLGANSYFSKPNTFEGLVALVSLLQNYWLNAALVPIIPLGRKK